MTDREAIEALTDKTVVNPYLTLEALEIAIDALRERAERKTGKWIDHSEDGYVECPICGHLTTCEGNIEDLHYCFWCGTRMEAGDADSNQMNDVDMYDTACPYTNKPCLGCGSFFTECPRCAVEKEEANQCDDDCEHCDYATCPKMEADE